MHQSRARSLRRARRILTATALAAVALPAAAAQAAEVTAVGTEIVVDDNGGRGGLETNRLITESLPGGELRLVDQVPLVVKTATCLNVTSLEVRCVRPSTSPISKLVFHARAGDDQLRPAGSLPIRFEGGRGADLYVGARTAAPTRVDFQGGIEEGDAAHYTNAQMGIYITKDDVANDGRSGAVRDRDNISKDVNVVIGTHFDDKLGGAVGVAETEEFRPLGGDDLVIGGDAHYSVVDMGVAKDGADRIVGGLTTQVSYEKRTNPIRAAVDLLGADDGEAGEGDELVGVKGVQGGSGDDRMLLGRVGPESQFGIGFNGGPGADVITGNQQRDSLVGGPGRDILAGDSGNDKLFAIDGDVDTVRCGLGADTAETDTAEETVTECETRILP